MIYRGVAGDESIVFPRTGVVAYLGGAISLSSVLCTSLAQYALALCVYLTVVRYAAQIAT